MQVRQWLWLRNGRNDFVTMKQGMYVMKTSTFKKIAVLVVLLLVLFSGSGCCTVELLMAAGHARNAHSVRERTASISEEKSTLAINIKEKIYHFYYPINKPPSRESNKQYQLKYPLKSAPFFVKRYQLIADVDENASRISFRNFNCFSKTCTNVSVTITNYY